VDRFESALPHPACALSLLAVGEIQFLFPAPGLGSSSLFFLTRAGQDEDEGLSKEEKKKREEEGKAKKKEEAAEAKKKEKEEREAKAKADKVNSIVWVFGVPKRNGIKP
jgi:hypothetical protein